MNPVIEMRSVTRTYQRGSTVVKALCGVNLSVDEGELVAIMGPSGSGKSTLLTIAGGLDRPSDGQVIVAGEDVTRASKAKLAALRRRSLGYVFQELNLIASLTAIENVMLPLELDGVGVVEAQRDALSTLAAVGMADTKDTFPEDLSGGQQQRVAIARSLVGRRKLLLADEPTGALDTLTGEAVMQVLRQRCDDGAAAVVVTHDARIAGWADRVVYLRDGLVVEESFSSPGGK